MLFTDFSFEYEQPASLVKLNVIDDETGDFTRVSEIPYKHPRIRATFGGKLYLNEFTSNFSVRHLMAEADDFDFSQCSYDELAEFIAALIRRAHSDRLYPIGSKESFLEFIKNS